MANLLIPASGALIGSMFGKTGAALGWMIGSAFSSSKNDGLGQDKLADLQVQTSQYGVSIPIVIGKQRVAGNIIWASNKRKYQNSDSFLGFGKGGGSSSSTPGYKIDMLIAICQGPIDGISKCWSDGTLITEANTGANKLPGILYRGTMTQSPDPVYASAVGASNAPAYRGIALMALHDYDLGASGRVPSFSFEVIKSGLL